MWAARWGRLAAVKAAARARQAGRVQGPLQGAVGVEGVFEGLGLDDEGPDFGGELVRGGGGGEGFEVVGVGQAGGDGAEFGDFGNQGEV